MWWRWWRRWRRWSCTSSEGERPNRGESRGEWREEEGAESSTSSLRELRREGERDMALLISCSTVEGSASTPTSSRPVSSWCSDSPRVASASLGGEGGGDDGVEEEEGEEGEEEVQRLPKGRQRLARKIP